MVFKTNMCFLDRIFRTVIGLALLYFAFVDTQFLSNVYIKILFGIFGLVNIGSAFLGHCPVYALANLSSIKKSNKPE